MGERFRWWAEYFAKYWKTLLPMGLMILSLFGVSLDSYYKSDTIEETKAQVAMVAELYRKEFPEVKPAQSCNCAKAIKAAIKAYDVEHQFKLH